jgi:putative transcriptional regulator
MDRSPYLSGSFLLALPGIGDARFERSVIAVCSHNEEGALGIGIGHVLAGITFHTILRKLEIDIGTAPDSPVHHGGPVEPSRGFVIHSLDWGGQGTVSVDEKWALSSTLDVLRAIASGKGLVAMGYAGWSAGQLDGELKRHGWHLADGNTDVIFEMPASARWGSVLEGQGIDPALLAATSGNA